MMMVRLWMVQVLTSDWSTQNYTNFRLVVAGPLTRRAIEEGTVKGRNGLGSIYVWASGNGGKFEDNW